MSPVNNLPPVRPPRRTYQPKYPSFADPNPLLHPETMPYPFTRRFAEWVAAGGLIGALALGSSGLAAQTTTDSLYNPFLLETAGVPYRPVMYGTGLPQRLSTQEVVTAVRRAFASSGIELKDNVWLKDEDLGAYLDGYSEKDKIGFMLLAYPRMDASFVTDWDGKGRPAADEVYIPQIDDLVVGYHARLAEEFADFIEDKETYLMYRTRRDNEGLVGDYARKLEAMEPQESLLDTFIRLNNELTIQLARESDSKNDFRKKVVALIDERVTDASTKAILLTKCSGLHRNIRQEELKQRADRALVTLGEVEQESVFCQGMIDLATFLQFNAGIRQSREGSPFMDLKLAIMDNHPPLSWVKHLDKLADFADRKTISLDEAQAIDDKNQSGELHVAPISMRGNYTIVPDAPYMSEANKKLWEATKKERDRRNGMTDEVIERKQEELNAVRDKYDYQKLQELTTEERKVKLGERAAARDAVNAKYRALEKLTDAEREEFKQRFAEINERAQREREELEARTRRESQLRLEQQVKLYIRWAKSQQGW